jgi:penicillin V acylase-like amidase (Ntn superfamily)
MRRSPTATFFLLVLVLGASWAAVPAQACTTFCLHKGPRALFGKNYDWAVADGLLVVNKRGVEKTAPLPPSERPARWVSKHGSVTFNQYGRELPNGGMNEAGLAVELMWLDETRWPDPDGRPSLGSLEWIQYQLDNFSTAGEVVKHLQDLRVTSQAKIHYLVCDKSGSCVTVEFLDGKPVHHEGVRALANHTYAASRGFLERNRGKEGALAGPGSLQRFARAATTAEAFAAKGGKDPVRLAFDTLDDVAQGDYTKWSIVYDLQARRIHWRTLGNRSVRYVELAAFDFSCDSPVKVLDVDAGRGNVAARFVDYTPEANRSLIERSVRKTDFLAGMPPEEIAEIARQPERTSCAAGGRKR